MIETIQQINFILGIGGIVGVFATIILLIDLFTNQRLKQLVSKWGMYVAFGAVTSSVTLTLVYSEVFGIIPCGLCWFERIVLYPQAVLVAVAFFYKDKYMPRYGIALSSIGVSIALYHHYLQMGGTQFIKCPAAGAGADCAKRFMFEFNIITFPLLAAILFAFLIVLYMYMLRQDV